MSKPSLPLFYNNDQLVETLDKLFIELNRRREALKRSGDAPITMAYYEDLKSAGSAIETQHSLIKEKIEQSLKFPPHVTKYLSKLSDFHSVASFEESVFIMTKLPDRGSPINPELNRVIQAVRDGVSKCGFYPRVATDIEYHDRVWDNVALYLIGCSKGVAILESCVRPELNPNVAVEVGWMKALNRDVFLLIENKFKELRADWYGLSEHRFSWERPGDDIPGLISDWLGSTD
jgi:hypothetical protein